MGFLFRLYILIFLFIGLAFANDIEITSDNISLDNKSGFYKFGGLVEATDGFYNLRSYEVSYDKQNKLLFSDFETSISNNTYVLVTDKIKLTEDFNYSEFSKLHFKFTSFGSLFAKSAVKKNQNIILNKAYFTMCRICKNDKFYEPIWKIKSKKASYNEEQDLFTFNHLIFYVLDIPVAYSPYLFANGNKNPKKSGLLYPTIANDTIMGNYFALPLFVNIKSNLDFTYTPTIFSKNNINHDLEIRHLGKKSNLVFDIAYLKLNDNFRESLAANGYQLYDKKKWRVKTSANLSNRFGDFNLDIHRTSSSDYLSRYLGDYRRYESSKIGFLSDNNNLMVKYSYVNDFSDYQRSYYRIPTFDYEKTIKLNQNLVLENDLNYDNVNLETESKRDRLSLTSKLAKKSVINKSDIWNFGFMNRVDSYGLFEDSESALRYQIGAYADWKRNYINTKHNIILTPKLFIATTNIIQNDDVANYDSESNNLNFANLMALNNAFGYDLIDEANKAALEISFLKSKKNESFEYRFGIKYSDADYSKYSVGSGLNSKFSDVLNNFSYSTESIKFLYFNRLDHSDFYPYYNSLSLSSKIAKLEIGATLAHVEYSHLDASLVDDKNLSSTFTYNFNKSLKITNRSNFSYADQSLFSGALTQNYLALLYNNRCFDAIFSITNRFYTNNDIKDDTTISLSVSIFDK